jgi:L-amino acid N-acyltransferase
MMQVQKRLVGEKTMRIIDCTYEAHADAILEIFNEVILNSTALYDYKPRAKDSMLGWFGTKAAGRYPVLGAIDDQGKLLGFASYGTFRVHPAYKYSIEHSVYVHHDHRGQGLGAALLTQLIDNARRQQYHVMVGAIDLTNQGSIALHQKLGFFHSGTITQAGFKFGRWLDLAFYQLLLDTPAQPMDG